MLKNDSLKNGTSRIGLYGSAPLPGARHASHIMKVSPFEQRESRQDKFFMKNALFL